MNPPDSPQPATPRYSKLYVRTALREYSEDAAMTAAGTDEDGWLHSRFAIEMLHAPLSLRFDPAAEAGLFKIERIVWRRLADERELASLRGDALQALIRHAEAVRMPGDAYPATYWATDDDPYVDFAWPAAVHGLAAVDVEFVWAFESLAASENQALLSAVTPAAEAPRGPAPAMLGSAEFGVALTSLQEVLAAAAQERSALRQQLREVHEQLQQQAMQSRDTVALAEGARQKYERRSRDTARSALKRWRHERQGQARQFERLLAAQSTHAREIKSNLDAMHQRAAHLQARIDDMAWIQQHSWRSAARRFSNGFSRFFAPFRRALSAKLDLIRRYTFVAERLGDIKHDARTDAWEVSGDDPRLSMRPKGLWKRPSAGWYMVDVSVRCEPPDFLVGPCLYPDYGQGLTEITRIPLPREWVESGRSQLVKFAGDVHYLRFDPTEESARLRIDRFRMRKLSWVEAALRLAWPAIRAAGVSPPRLLQTVSELWRVWYREGTQSVERRLNEHVDRLGDKQDYTAWVQRFDRLDDPQRAALIEAEAGLSRRPRISVLLPTYNSPEGWLRRCLDSVLAQVYPDWELCVVDDASTQPHVRLVLEEYATRDTRVRVRYRERNGHIVASTNDALAMATGEFVALLDHDDEIPEFALLLVAEFLGRHPQLKIVYTDEDKVDEQDRRYDPYFKPDWNPDLLLSQNFISHLGIYRADLVREVGGFRAGFEGSQDYDLTLRCTEAVKADEIGHLPQILYHWRAVSGSTALATTEKNYPLEAGRRAIAEALQRRGSAATVEITPGCNYRVRYPVPSPAPRVSLIVPTRDRVDLVRVCVESILEKTDYPNYEIVIVDNQSRQPETLSYFAQIVRDPRVRVLSYDAPFNFSAMNNFAVEQVDADVVGLINNDIEAIHADWLGEMVGHAMRPEIGAVGAMLYYPDDTIQHAGVIVGFGGVAGHAYSRVMRGYAGQMNRARLVQNLSSVTAACLLIRRKLYIEVGGLDPALTVAFNDIDFCLRVRDSGYRNVWTPFAELYHHESASRGYEDSPEKQARFNGEIRYMQQRWGESLLRDPAYNPNLALDGVPFALAWPPRERPAFRAGPVRRAATDTA